MVLTRFELEVHCSAVVAEELLTLLALARWCLLITDFTLRIIHVVNYAVQPRFIVYKKTSFSEYQYVNWNCFDTK